MNKFQRSMVPVVVFGCLIIGSVGLTQTPKEAKSSSESNKGRQIAEEFDRRDQGWGDFRADMEMILKNKQGQTSTRKLRVSSLEGQGNQGDKTLMVFESPRDIQGTALLTHSHPEPGVSNDQWLYLPSLRRVKRIASANKTGAFMGSEFTYEDLSPPELEKYTYKYIRDETFKGNDCFVIDRFPKDPNSGYTRERVWIDKKEYRPFKVKFIDRKEYHLKTMTFVGYKKFLENTWRPSKMKMVNHQTGKSTVLKWTNYRFKVGLYPRDFTPDRLKRIR